MPNDNRTGSANPDGVSAKVGVAPVHLFTRHPYDSLRGSQLSQILKEL